MREKIEVNFLRFSFSFSSLTFGDLSLPPSSYSFLPNSMPKKTRKGERCCRHFREQSRVLPSPKVPFLESLLILNWSRVCTSWSRGWKVSRKIEKRSPELIVTVIRSLLFSPCKTCLPKNFLWLLKPSKCLTGKKMRLPRDCTFFTDSFLGSEFFREEFAREN